MKRFIILLLFTIYLFALSPICAQINLVFRIDDYYCSESELCLSVLNTFREVGVPLSIGVTPFDEEENLVFDADALLTKTMQEAAKTGEVEICLHGLTHSKLGKGGEFAGVEYNEQERRLQKGTAALAEIFCVQPVTFIPPFNGYDKNTLQILHNLGYSSVSGDMYGVFDEQLLSAFPETFGANFKTPSTVLQSLQVNKKHSGTMVAMLHPYDFTEKYTVDDLRQMLQKIAEMKNVHCYTFATMPKNCDASAQQVALNLKQNLLRKQLSLKNMLFSVPLLTGVRLTNALLHALLSVFVAFCVMLVANRTNRKRKSLSIYLSIYLSIAILAFCITWFHLLTPLKGLVLCLLMAIFVAIIVEIFIKKKVF